MALRRSPSHPLRVVRLNPGRPPRADHPVKGSQPEAGAWRWGPAELVFPTAPTPPPSSSSSTSRYDSP